MTKTVDQIDTQVYHHIIICVWDCCKTLIWLLPASKCVNILKMEIACVHTCLQLTMHGMLSISSMHVGWPFYLKPDSKYHPLKTRRVLIGPFPLTQIVALIWVAIRSATQISATIFIFMCGDRKVAIISAILIAIRAPLIVRLFENNRDYLK